MLARHDGQISAAGALVNIVGPEVRVNNVSIAPDGESHQANRTFLETVQYVVVFISTFQRAESTMYVV